MRLAVASSSQRARLGHNGHNGSRGFSINAAKPRSHDPEGIRERETVTGPVVSVVPFVVPAVMNPLSDQAAAAPNSSFRVRSNRSAFITLVQALTKSFTNFSPASAEA
jgi:hypothetical protein